MYDLSKNLKVLYDDNTQVVIMAYPSRQIFTISPADLSAVSQMSIGRTAPANARDGYVYVRGSHEKLARILLGSPHGLEIDHINNDITDNRRENLRIVTHQQNQINQPRQKNNTSGYIGVSYCAERHAWDARLTISGTTVLLGRYRHKRHAAFARYIAEELLYGDYACRSVPRISHGPIRIMRDVIKRCKTYASHSLNPGFASRPSIRYWVSQFVHKYSE